MAIQCYVNFAGQCREAVEFYADAFGAPEPKFMTFGEIPPDPKFPLPEEAKKLIMHAELEFEGGKIMFSDLPPNMSLAVGNNVSLVVVTKEAETLRRYWSKLKAGARVTMDLGPQFWTPLYGFLYDKYGIGWQLSLEP